MLRRALADNERGYGSLKINITDEAFEVWAIKSDGDARRALNALEVAVLSQKKAPRQEGIKASSPNADASMPSCPDAFFTIDRATAEDSIQQKAAVYDGTGDEHYDAISAMIKSVRGSDPDAAVYWIARMLEAGEDPRFVARRLAVLASEDIGNADPRGIMVAEAAWSLAERVGMPEARITLSQCATYLALAPKSNAAYVAIDAAIRDVREGRTVMVPMHLRGSNSSPVGEGVRVRDAEDERYAYNHRAEHRVDGLPVTGQDYLGVSARYYEPIDAGFEREMAARLAKVRALRAELAGQQPPGKAGRPEPERADTAGL